MERVVGVKVEDEGQKEGRGGGAWGGKEEWKERQGLGNKKTDEIKRQLWHAQAAYAFCVPGSSWANHTHRNAHMHKRCDVVSCDFVSDWVYIWDV